jgi:hypothetical protein
MSRFADQLPIVTEPTPGNYLLGTDENDPKALVRIPAEGLGNGGGSTEYTILDETALDVDSNVVLSAGLYLYVGNAPANFDLSGLVDGERVEIINHTNYKCYLFNFAKYRYGSIVNLENNKGIVLEQSGISGGIYNGELTILTPPPNGVTQDWMIGFIPPGFLYWKVSFSTGYLTEIQMDLGNGPLRIYSANGIESINPLNELTDGVVPNSNSGFVSSTTLTIKGFNNLDIKDFWVAPQAGGPSGPVYNQPETFTASYSIDGVNWQTSGFGIRNISQLTPSALTKIGYSL